jgi:hypothetical protein
VDEHHVGMLRLVEHGPDRPGSSPAGLRTDARTARRARAQGLYRETHRREIANEEMEGVGLLEPLVGIWGHNE